MNAANEREVIEPVRAIPSEILGKYESILNYGPFGTGKTFTAGTAPEPIWFLTPGGTNEVKTVFSPKFIKAHGRKEIFITSVLEDRKGGMVEDNPSGYDRCCHAVEDFIEWNTRDGMGVQTIVVDNATVLEEYMLNKAIYAEYMMAGSKEKSVLVQERNFGIRKPHDGTWGGAQSFMNRFVAELKELPFHLVFIAHTYDSYRQIPGSREKELIKTLPLFVGKQRTEILNSFDNVWFAMVSGGGRSQTWGIKPEGDERIAAKTRVGGILDPNYEANPNIAEIIAQFQAHARSLEEEEQTG